VRTHRFSTIVRRKLAVVRDGCNGLAWHWMPEIAISFSPRLIDGFFEPFLFLATISFKSRPATAKIARGKVHSHLDILPEACL